MPRIYTPPTAPAAEVQGAMSVFQVNSLRAEIIRDLAMHPEGSTTSEAGARLGVDYRQVYKHVNLLLEQGIVRVVGQGQGHRRGPIYLLDREALESRNAALMRHLLGDQ